MKPQSTHKVRELVSEITPRRVLDDLVLPRACRTAVDQLIEEQQKSSLLRAHGLDPRHRLLLVGPPGNGKTSLAEAIAGALALPFFVVRYDAVIGSYLGETTTHLKRVFDHVRTTPCVLFFDEFDAVGKERGDIHEIGEIKRVVSSLLMHIDELPSFVVVVAATNHSELLDRAVWRRFQLRLGLPAPGEKELTEYFDRFLASFDKRLGVSGASSDYFGPFLTPVDERPAISGATIAVRLGAISYAEAEEFVLDVRRRDVMTMQEHPLERTIEEQLVLWEQRVQPTRSNEAKPLDDRA
jgi:SpoVK/Ycf46/Vps4 family AAA+-type ATPase